MSAESWQRLKGRGWIVCVLFGIAIGLLDGGWQGGIKGALFGNLGASMFLGLVSRLEHITRRSMLGGMVGAGLLVTGELLVLSLSDRSVPVLWIGVTLPIMALSGFSWGALLSESRARFVLVGALLGALPLPLISLIAHSIASGKRELTTLITATLVGALLVAAIGWMTQRWRARLWIWAISGAIFGFVFVMFLYRDVLVFGQQTASRPITATEMLGILKFMAVFGAMQGGMLGALFGPNALFPGGLKLFDDQSES